MTPEVARRAIDIALREPDRPGSGERKVAFFGGEPLLQWDLLVETVSYARGCDLRGGPPLHFGVTTNGLALSAPRLAYLKSQGFALCFSFDGSREAQEACRPFPDGSSSFDATDRRLREALEVFPDLEAVTVVSPANVRALPQSVSHLLERGVKKVVLNPDYFSQWSNDDLEAWREAYGRVAALFVERYRAGHECFINVLVVKIITRIRGGYQPGERCDFGGCYAAIAPSGNIYPCQRSVNEDHGGPLCMGNVFDGLLAGRKRAMHACQGACNPACRECALRPRCRNWCGCVNAALSGDPATVPGLVCFHERLAIETTDRAAGTLFAEQNPAFMRTFYPGE
jgi:uncharacterized protein